MSTSSGDSHNLESPGRGCTHVSAFFKISVCSSDLNKMTLSCLIFKNLQEYCNYEKSLTEPPQGFNSTRGVKTSSENPSDFKVCFVFLFWMISL